ncbi:CLUMA_CG003117, isoform A [Clunio marinus]|uniref:CLUMA_CG003117, isoform A n=1 Tax=Clunio marinus TaxID=568069 RepID=A0A1J1HT39_9DIPT|nr:CLUMA_CG003117, isoform A [Clunio marinus]
MMEKYFANVIKASIVTRVSSMPWAVFTIFKRVIKCLSLDSLSTSQRKFIGFSVLWSLPSTVGSPINSTLSKSFGYSN